MQRSVGGFTNPFRYVPHPLVREAAGQILDLLESWRKEPDGSSLRELERCLAEGKMLGVLVVAQKSSDEIHRLTPLKTYSIIPKDNCSIIQNDTSTVILNEVKNLRFIAAFSGTIRKADGPATATAEGFVPPIIDLTAPDGYFRKEEARISELNSRISRLYSSAELEEARTALKEALAQRDEEISQMQENIHLSKSRRNELRQKAADPLLEKELIRESQFQKAQLKRLKDKWKAVVEELSAAVKKTENEIAGLKFRRANMSDGLQKWIFENAVVHNALGESATIWDIFRRQDLTPPGGTGECAAPKLLEYAYKNGLQPLAMGEFWYGKSPDTAVRTHGHFYPSCTSKCGPLLEYMMQGLSLQNITPTAPDNPVIIHEDDAVIVVEKPSGMPSVPGLDGRLSLQELLTRHTVSSEVHSVHRLDMDTSGVMVFAKTSEAAVYLRRQFEEHTVRKTYVARLANQPLLRCKSENPQTETVGVIELPLCPDYDERPRQKVDFKQGKPAHTDYRILRTNHDGTTDILLYPLTGRTHQLRVHCAHNSGLARPIAGDLLYGAYTAENSSVAESRSCPSLPSRLCLHALSITFTHPLTDVPQTFTSDRLSY